MSENRSGRTPLEELKKQLVDQPLHALWGFSTGIFPWLVVHFAGNWGALSVAASILSAIIWALREIDQADDGSHVSWDPWLDSTVWFLAGVGGVICGVTKL